MNFNDMSLFYYKDLYITSIHFDGDGPNGNYQTLDLDGNTYSSNSDKSTNEIDISKFIKFEFETKFFQFKKLNDFELDPTTNKKRTSEKQIQEQTQEFKTDTQIKKDTFNSLYRNFKINVNVICGDTNITENKSNLSRCELGMKIAKGLNEYFILSTERKEWLVLMSSHKISKNRRGFILKNQQIHKSIERNNEVKTEADGTILAIKIFTDIKTTIIENWKNIFYQDDIIDPAADEFVIYSATSVHPVNKNFRGKPLRSEAFVFRILPEHSLNTKRSTPIEKVFIDHSVLYSNFTFLVSHVNKDIIDYTSRSKPLLIVLNLNSMINAGKKNWNLKIKDYVNIVTKFDTVLYNLLRDQMYQKINETTFNEYKAEYDQFNGTDKTLHYVKNLSPTELKKINIAVTNAFNKTIEQKNILLIKGNIQQLTPEFYKNLLLETKYLKKEYYEKYIKYKTKYLNLKNT